METLFLLSKARLFAFEIRSDSVKVKVAVAIVQVLAVYVAPIRTDLRLLIKSCAIRTEKSEVLDLK